MIIQAHWEFYYFAQSQRKHELCRTSHNFSITHWVTRKVALVLIHAVRCPKLCTVWWNDSLYYSQNPYYSFNFILQTKNRETSTTVTQNKTFLFLLDVKLGLKGKNKYKVDSRRSHSNSRSSSASSVSMLVGSAIGPSWAKRLAISFSVFSRSCFFFSWIFFSLWKEKAECERVHVWVFMWIILQDLTCRIPHARAHPALWWCTWACARFVGWSLNGTETERRNIKLQIQTSDCQELF